MKVFSIIVTYNGMQWLERCLSTLMLSTISTQIVVIDNASTDGTADYVPSHFPNVVWMPQAENLGFGQANNKGIKYAVEHGADYVLLLNQDAYLQPDALEKMIAQSDGKSLISPLQLTGDGTRLDPMFRVSMRLTCDVSTMIDDLLLKGLEQMEPVYEAAEIGAACWLMPIALINRIGGFNPMFFHYSEDNNYYQRMAFHKTKVLLVPKAHVWHDRKQLYGNVQAFNKNRVRRDLILVACNINWSKLFRSYKFLVVLIHCYRDRTKGQAYLPGTWLMQMCWILLHTAQIHHVREIDKQVGLHWL